MPETTEPQLTESDVAEYEKRRYAAVRSYHSGDDVNWFLTVAIPALIRDWRALRTQLVQAQTVIDAACALSCAGCAANLPLAGTVHKPTAAQSELGYEPAECEAKGAARVSREITEMLK